MLNALAAADPITPDWLTRALHAAGALPAGEVIACDVAVNAAFNSAASHLLLTYSEDAPADAPRRLFLKRNIDTAWAIEAGRDEVRFYQIVAGLDPRPPAVIPCYLAAFDAERGASSLLLTDVSATHSAPRTRDDLLRGEPIPDQRSLDLAIDALASFHAYWWQRPELGATFALAPWYSDAAAFAAHVERRRGEWARFLAAEGAWFPADLRAVYEETLARLPSLWDAGLGAHMTTGRGLTLGHGDCYSTQFLVPRPGVAAPTYLVDFQGVAADTPAFDLIHMFASFWTREQRQTGDLETRCLRRYYAGLVAGGVADYSREQLLADYANELAIMLFYPVWDETNGSPQSYWLPKMRSLVAAWQDHRRS
ncbi:MAG TPA: oxidoreductase family protein [Ktedonobacterales bacterium]